MAPSSVETITSFPVFGEDSQFCYIDDEEDVPLSQVSHHDDNQPPSPLYATDAMLHGRSNKLVKEVGFSGSILGKHHCEEGVCVDMGFEFLVRIAIRNIVIAPAEVQAKLISKYGRQAPNAEKISTTWSGTDACIDHKLAVIIACRLLSGLQNEINEFCSFSLIQTLSVEIDDWKRARAICGRERHPSHSLRVLAKD